MLSSLPKLADRNFIIGFFVPTLITALVIVWLFRDFEVMQQVYDAVWKEKKWEEITIFALAVWVFAMILMLINHQIYRMAEGYIGPLAWLGNQRMAAKRDALALERRTLIDKDANETDQFKKQRLNRRIDSIDLELVNYFPHANFPVLPSRFGNAIRAFESYAPIVYGVDSIPAWVRLVAIIPKQLVSATADARAEVDFFLNVFVLSLILMLIALGRYLVTVSGFWVICETMRSEMRWTFLICIGISLSIAYLAYSGAVARAVAWGEHVKSAFDLYLPKLANTLGYNLPNSSDERREFWNAFSLMTLYFQPMDLSRFSLISVTAEAAKSEKEGKTDSPGDDNDTDEQENASDGDKEDD